MSNESDFFKILDAFSRVNGGTRRGEFLTIGGRRMGSGKSNLGLNLLGLTGGLEQFGHKIDKLVFDEISELSGNIHLTVDSYNEDLFRQTDLAVTHGKQDYKKKPKERLESLHSKPSKATEASFMANLLGIKPDKQKPEKQPIAPDAPTLTEQNKHIETW